ncbi:hypothetical protein K505DRAFT_380340 [Melanomma pulvis-pyrius CBS 109.77]|uniref:Uncharacterized protein n=1 Tax=Melanomma pulvis-pyrius CBS 109.77 TaxID=1314802 RepID=A0A6A6WQZ6_9PLEO|nr:hypothetical protein K505DRAFT_380340 [Melanomma pulvis-pyrius CBS 109.77]
MIKHTTNDESSTQRKERLQQKVSKAALTVFTKNALLRDQNRFLKGINNEGKARRSTKSKILGRAKVITFEDLQIARAEDEAKEAKKAETNAKRAERIAKKAAKQAANTPLQVEEATISKKRGRKRKGAAEDAEVADAGPSRSKAKVVKTSKQVADASPSGSKVNAEGVGPSQPKAKIPRVQAAEGGQRAKPLEPKATGARTSEVQAWKALVARMW